jgi:hypothetical protein
MACNCETASTFFYSLFLCPTVQLSRCYTLHFTGIKILIKYFQIIFKYHAVIILLYAYCNGPLPLNGQTVTDVISAVTDTDSYPITRNSWAKRCIRGNRYAL